MLFERDQAFLFQAAHELVIQFVQNIAGQLFVLKLIKSIPLGLLAFGQPDKSKVSFT